MLDDINISIYKISDEMSLSAFMNDYHLAMNKFNIWINPSQQAIFEYKVKTINESNLDWRYQEALSVEQLKTNINFQFSAEKNMASKLFFANNQYLADKLNKDIFDYQEYRKEQARLTERLIQHSTQLELIEQFETQYEMTNIWSNKVNSIFQNIAAEMQIMLDNFEKTWDSTFEGPEIFANSIRALWDFVAKPLIDKYMEDLESDNEEMEKYYIEFQDQYKKFALTEEAFEEIPDWLKSHEGERLSAEEIFAKADNELKVQIRSEGLNSITKASMFDKICNVLNPIYAMNQVIFGSLHEQANEIYTYANQRVPQMLVDIGTAYNENGIPWTNVIEEEVEFILKQVVTSLSEIASVFKPLQVATGFINVAFDTASVIEDWFKTITVRKDLQEQINLIINIGETQSRIDEELVQEAADISKLKTELNKELGSIIPRLEELNDLLSKSDLVGIQENTNKITDLNNEIQNSMNISNELNFLFIKASTSLMFTGHTYSWYSQQLLDEEKENSKKVTSTTEWIEKYKISIENEKVEFDRLMDEINQNDNINTQFKERLIFDHEIIFSENQYFINKIYSILT